MKNLLRGLVRNSFICFRGVRNMNRVNYRNIVSYSNRNNGVVSVSGKVCSFAKRFNNTNDVGLHWENAEDIADLLFEEYKNVDPLALKFEELENMIIDTVVNKNKKKLNGSCNEGVLENIQMNWLEKYNEANE